MGNTLWSGSMVLEYCERQFAYMVNSRREREDILSSDPKKLSNLVKLEVCEWFGYWYLCCHISISGKGTWLSLQISKYSNLSSSCVLTHCPASSVVVPIASRPGCKLGRLDGSMITSSWLSFDRIAYTKFLSYVFLLQASPTARKAEWNPLNQWLPSQPHPDLFEYS